MYRKLPPTIKAEGESKSAGTKLSLIALILRFQEDGISRTVSLISPISGYIKAVNVIWQVCCTFRCVIRDCQQRQTFARTHPLEKDADKVVIGSKVQFFINNETENTKR